MSQEVDFLQDYEVFYRHFLERRSSKEVLEDSTRWLREKTKNSHWATKFQEQLRRDFRSSSLSSLYAETAWLQTTSTQRLNLIFILNKYFLYHHGSKKIDQSKWEQIMNQIINSSLQVIHNQKELGHLHKIFRAWNGAGLFRDQVDTWESLVAKKLKPSTESIAEAKSELPTVLRQKRSFSTAMDIEVPSSQSKYSMPVEDVVNFRTMLVESMQKLVYRICQYYHAHAANSSDAIYWRVYMFTSMDLLQQFCRDFQLEDNVLAIALASLFLAGKMESMFLKPNKLKSTASKYVTELFGAEMTMPEDNEIFQHEMKLLQILQFDSNRVCNPIPVLQRWLNEKVIDQSLLTKCIDLCCQERFVQHIAYLQYPANVLACFLQLVVRCQHESSEEKLSLHMKYTYYGCFRELDDNMQFLALWKEYTLQQMKELSIAEITQLSTVYRMMIRFFQHCTRIKPLPSDYLNMTLLEGSGLGIEMRTGSVKKKAAEISPNGVAGANFTSTSLTMTPPNPNYDANEIVANIDIVADGKEAYEPLIAKPRREKMKKDVVKNVVVVLVDTDETSKEKVQTEKEKSPVLTQDESATTVGEKAESSIDTSAEKEAVVEVVKSVEEVESTPKEKEKEVETLEDPTEDSKIVAVEEEKAKEDNVTVPSRILDDLLADSKFSSESLVSRSTDEEILATEDKSSFDLLLSRGISVTEELAKEIACKAKIISRSTSVEPKASNKVLQEEEVQEPKNSVKFNDIPSVAKKDVFGRLGGALVDKPVTTSSSLASTLPTTESMEQNTMPSNTQPAVKDGKVGGGSRLLSRALAGLKGNSANRSAKPLLQSNSGNTATSNQTITFSEGVATLNKRRNREVMESSDAQKSRHPQAQHGRASGSANKRIRSN